MGTKATTGVLTAIGVTALLACGGLMIACSRQSLSSPRQKSDTPEYRGGVGPHLASPSQRAALRALYGKEDSLAEEGRRLYLSGRFHAAEKVLLASLAAAPAAQKPPNPDTEQMLGRIYLREGRNSEAIPHLQACDPYIAPNIQGDDLTIAYARLGELSQARNSYRDHLLGNPDWSDQPLKAADIPGASAYDDAAKRRAEGADSERLLKAMDLPGTSDLRALEASALLERGLDDYMHADYDSALGNLSASERLAPNSIMTNYFLADVMARHGRNAEAASLLKKVVASPRGSIFPEARQRLTTAEILAARH